MNYNFSRVNITEKSEREWNNFCNSEYPIAKDRYINCNYASREYGVSIELGNVPVDISGSAFCPDNAEVLICNKQRDERGDKWNPDKVYVNTQKCSQIFGNTATFEFKTKNVIMGGNGGGSVDEPQDSYLSCNDVDVCEKINGVADNEIKATSDYIKCQGINEGENCREGALV